MVDLGSMTSFLDGKKIALPAGVVVVIVWIIIAATRASDLQAAQEKRVTAIEAAYLQQATAISKLSRDMLIVKVQNKEIARAVDAKITYDPESADDDSQ